MYVSFNTCVHATATVLKFIEETVLANIKSSSSSSMSSSGSGGGGNGSSTIRVKNNRTYRRTDRKTETFSIHLERLLPHRALRHTILVFPKVLSNKERHLFRCN